MRNRCGGPYDNLGVPALAHVLSPGGHRLRPQLPPAASRTVDYDADIRPILAQHCYSCHGPEAQQSGLRLDLRQPALRGGDYGPVITPGNSADSKLIKRVVNGDGGLQMPPTGPLSDEEITLLRAWIDQGADFRTEIRAGGASAARRSESGCRHRGRSHARSRDARDVDCRRSRARHIDGCGRLDAAASRGRFRRDRQP